MATENGISVTPDMAEADAMVNDTSPNITSFSEYQIALWINRYCPVVAVTVAVIGNGATLTTLLKMRPFCSLSLFLSYLAITDTLCVGINFLYTLLTRHNVTFGSAGCKFMMFFMNYFTYLANWTVVIMTAERFVAVTFPLQISRWFCMKRSILYLIVMAGVLVGLPCTVFLTFTELGDTPETRECFEWPEYQELSVILSWLDLVTFALLPCLILVVLNALIIRKLQRSAKERHEVLASNQFGSGRVPGKSQGKTKVPHGNLSVMLVTVSVAFVILQLPITIYYIITGYRDTPTEPKDKAVRILASNVVHTLNDLNHSLNFIFYFLSGRKFRRKFLQVFACGKIKKFIRMPKSEPRGSKVSQPLSSSDTRASNLCSLSESAGSIRSLVLKNRRPSPSL